MVQQQIENMINESRGMVANIHTAFMTYPDGVLAHYRFYTSVMLNDGPLPRVVRECIAKEVSIANRCDYCSHHHSAALSHHLSGELSEIELEYLKKFAELITKQPQRASELKMSFPYNTEGAWEHAILIASYFNMVNRMAFATGIEIEEDFKISCH